MTKDEALKLALEALKRATNYDPVIARAITAIKEALAQPEHGWTPERIAGMARLKDAQDKRLAQPEQEPVAFENWHKANYVQNLERYGDTYKNNHVRCRHQGWLGAQSFLPQRTWVGLTDEEKADLFAGTAPYYNEADYADAIEAKLKEKNT